VLLTRKFLHRAYVAQNRELRDIAAEVGVSHETVRAKLMLYGIPVRNRGTRCSTTRRKFREIPRRWLEREYVERGRTMNSLADERGVDPKVISRALEHHGLPKRCWSDYTVYPRLTEAFRG
jgi:DNA-binding phage protein